MVRTHLRRLFSGAVVLSAFFLLVLGIMWVSHQPWGGIVLGAIFLLPLAYLLGDLVDLVRQPWRKR